MEWRDQGALLAVRRHGETAAIIEVFTAAHGRHAGVVRGGASRKVAPVLQPGAQLDLTWRARLDDHLGHFTVEPLQSRTAILSDRAALSALNAICALLSHALPERDSHPALYPATIALLDALEGADWQQAYLRWELLRRAVPYLPPAFIEANFAFSRVLYGPLDIPPRDKLVAREMATRLGQPRGTGFEHQPHRRRHRAPPRQLPAGIHPPGSDQRGGARHPGRGAGRRTQRRGRAGS